MARIRTIKPEFFYSEQITSVSVLARLFFIGLWTLADREGRLQWSSRKLKAQIFPFDDVEVCLLAEELTTAGLMHVYEVQNAAYAWIPGFTKHQRPHPKEPVSVAPACPDGHDHKDIPWSRAVPLPAPLELVEPRKETASTGTIPSSPVGREGKEISGREGKEIDDYAARRRPEPLIVSPAKFEQKRDVFAFFGSRLKVPWVLHNECRDKLGGVDPTTRLLDWYYDLNKDAEESGEPIPDVFPWLRPKFVAWASEAQAASELERFRPKGA